MIMFKSNATDILKTFSVEELDLFEKFITSPYFNSNSRLSKFFSLLRQHHPDFSSSELTRPVLFKLMQGAKPYKDTYVRNMLSDLQEAAESFLVIRKLNKEEVYQRLLIEELKDRNLSGLAGKNLNRFELIVNNSLSKDHDHYFNRSFIYEMRSFLTVDKTLTDNFRNEQLAGTIRLFAITLLETSFYLLVEEQRVNVKHRYDFLKLLLDYIRLNVTDFEESPLLMVYFNLWQSYLNRNDPKFFDRARKIFAHSFEKMDTVDRKNIFSVMQMYYLNRMDDGGTKCKREYLDFLLEILKLNVLSHSSNERIDINLYRNVLIICMMLKEKTILRNFISKYISITDESSRDSLHKYSLAHLHFLEGDYGKALDMCTRVRYSELLSKTEDNLYFKNDIRTLTLKCLYELKATDGIMAAIDSYKHFLRNSRLLKNEQKRRSQDFLNILKRLANLRTKFDEYSRSVIRNRLLSDNSIPHSDWLKDKLAEFGDR